MMVMANAMEAIAQAVRSIHPSQFQPIDGRLRASKEMEAAENSMCVQSMRQRVLVKEAKKSKKRIA